MPGRRNRPDALSAAEAFWRSIDALGPDHDGRVRWLRAQHETILSQSQLEKCATGARPIRLQDAELLDLINLREGGIAHNTEALLQRREAALADHDEPVVAMADPRAYLERAASDLKQAIRAVEWGRGNTVELRKLNTIVLSHVTRLTSLLTQRSAEHTAEPRSRWHNPEPARFEPRQHQDEQDEQDEQPHGPRLVRGE